MSPPPPYRKLAGRVEHHDGQLGAPLQDVHAIPRIHGDAANPRLCLDHLDEPSFALRVLVRFALSGRQELTSWTERRYMTRHLDPVWVELVAAVTLCLHVGSPKRERDTDGNDGSREPHVVPPERRPRSPRGRDGRLGRGHPITAFDAACLTRRLASTFALAATRNTIRGSSRCVGNVH